jgi:hypothetical protein
VPHSNQTVEDIVAVAVALGTVAVEHIVVVAVVVRTTAVVVA